MAKEHHIAAITTENSIKKTGKSPHRFQIFKCQSDPPSGTGTVIRA
jgi:hypothetical protein